MVEDADTLQAGYIPLSPSRTALGAQPSVVALPVPRPYGRRNISAMAIEQSLPDAVGAFVGLAGARERLEGDDPAESRHARAGAAGPRLHPVPPLRQLRHRRHARLRGRARGARRAPPARRRPRLPRSRGDRDAARRAGRDRVARRRAVGVRDAARRALRDRRRGAARVPASLPARLSSVPRAAGSAGAPEADRRHAARAGAPARRCATAGRWPKR